MAGARPLALQRRRPAGINGNGRDARGAFLGENTQHDRKHEEQRKIGKRKEQITTTAGGEDGGRAGGNEGGESVYERDVACEESAV